MFKLLSVGLSIQSGLIVAATESPLPAADWLARAGSVTILAAAVIAFQRGWIVSGKTLDRALADRDRALELVYTHAGLVARVVDLSAERLSIEEKAAAALLKLTEAKEAR